MKLFLFLARKLASALIYRFRYCVFRLSYPRVKIFKPDPGYYSQAGQDILASRLIFPIISKAVGSNDFFFIDIGANHPIIFSNSYYFERFYGIKCLAVDPLPDKKLLWEQLRPDAILNLVLLV